MAKTLSEYAEGRDNNFNLIRFIAAAMVLFSHSYPLTGNNADEPLAFCGLTMGAVAVQVFFLTSGYLVTNSLLRSKRILDFAVARALRIFPGLFVANLFAVFVIGAFYTTFSVKTYLETQSIYIYLWRNTKLFFSSIQYKLPGVFAHTPLAESVNGSLWTLRPEVILYFWLAVIGIVLRLLAPRINKLQIALIFGVVALGSVGRFAIESLQQGHAKPDAILTILFFIGATFCAANTKVRLRGSVAAMAAAALICAAFLPKITLWVLTVTIGYLIFYLAYVPAGKVRYFNKLGDYSYGIYIYAFPIQQAIATSFPGISALAMTMIAFPVVLLLAVISWHGVEKPILALKRKRVERGVSLSVFG